MAEQEGSPLEESSGYSKYGITDLPKTSVATAWGQTKTCAGLSVKEWVFIVVSVVNILVAIGLTLVRFIDVIIHDPAKPDFTFALLLLVNAASCLFYVGHGVLRERVYELYVFIIAILVVLVYCIVEYAFLNVEGRSTLKLVRLILACVLAPPNIFLAWSVAQHFGYLQFRIVGASEYLQHLYQQASIFSCLLKFDVQVTTSFVILVLEEGTDLNLLEQITIGVGIPYALLWNIMGWFVLRRESKVGAWVFAFLGIVKPAYYIFKLVKMYRDLDDSNSKLTDTIVYSLLAAGMLALLVWLMIMAELIVVYRNFGQGLKERAYDRMASENTSLLTGRRSRRH